MADLRPESIIVGRVRKAHGVRGDLVVEPITDAPDEVFVSGRRVLVGTVAGDPDPRGRTLHVSRTQPFKGGLIVHFEEIVDRNDADTWRDRYLLLPVDEVAPPAEDQVYLHDLPGMQVVLETGEPVGTVAEVYELPQGLALEVTRATGDVLVPYDRFVTSVDRSARIIRIDPPAGLLD